MGQSVRPLALSRRLLADMTSRVAFEQIECPSEVLLQTQTCVCKA